MDAKKEHSHHSRSHKKHKHKHHKSSNSHHQSGKDQSGTSAHPSDDRDKTGDKSKSRKHCDYYDHYYNESRSGKHLKSDDLNAEHQKVYSDRRSCEQNYSYSKDEQLLLGRNKEGHRSSEYAHVSSSSRSGDSRTREVDDYHRKHKHKPTSQGHKGSPERQKHKRSHSPQPPPSSEGSPHFKNDNFKYSSRKPNNSSTDGKYLRNDPHALEDEFVDHDRQTVNLMKDYEKHEEDRERKVVEKDQCDDSDTEDIGPDFDFDWEDHRRTLNSMFFREDDCVQRNSQEYQDFWDFLRKYQLFQRKKASKGQLPKGPSRIPTDNPLGLPAKYDKRYKVNISMPKKDCQALYDRYVASDRRGGDFELTVGRISQFKAILLHYLDFAQKKKFAKLVKIKRDQRNLPIYQHKQQIIDTIRENQVTVVAGDTGCGKSTQVPQYLLEAGFTKISCTQPRRIACISLAKRVSFETLNEYGSEVAHQVRFEKTKTRATRILFLTEGLLLRQISSDAMLSQYSVIVIDEVHERHINTDFLLGVLKCILLQREDLKLVLMSATINIDLFSSYFNHCPVCKVPGRLYPITLEYRPLTIDEQGSKSERLDPAPYLRVLQLINHKYPDTERGDVLMFLSGMSEIMSVAEAARAYAQKTKKWIILSLHSSLSIAEQEKVFDIAPDGVRKCIISTNIAETSVTIDGVRFVVDSGKVKEMSFDIKYKMQKLQEFWISTASSEQRKGRAGRTGPGVCYRLYSESDYGDFQEYSTPEIQRVPLDSLILQMIAMGLPDARKFPFLEAPSDTTVETSLAFLKEQGAISPKEELTPVGQMLSQLPVDVIIGKMLIMASIFQLVDPVLSIAASLSVQTPFTSKSQRDMDAINNRKDLESDHGDAVTLLNAFDEWIRIKAEGQDTRKWCSRRGLEQQRFYEMSKLKRQFQDLLQEYGLVTDADNDESSHMTREERRRRNIDRKHLRDLRQEQRKMGKKRKVLKMEDEDWDVEMEGEDKEEAPDLDMDIKDLEFKLSNNLDKLQEKHNESRSFTLKEVTLLKVILCSGLFPQVAIADEHNSFKSDTDQIFHTKNKGFVLIHPSSVFCQHPDVLELKEHEIKEDRAIGSTTKGRLSNRHQLLAFVSLLETQKPYLTSCLRIPGLQTLLLFCSTLDTNADCTRIVCDEWLEVRFEEAEEAESILSAAVKLRHTWLQLLELKLQVSGVDRKSMEPDIVLERKIRKVQKTLSQKLAEFLYCDVYYYIRRILSAEVQHLYVGPIFEQPSSDGNVQTTVGGLLNAGGDPHPYKGGVQVNSYLVYNCLQDDGGDSAWGDYMTCLQRHWTCPWCNESKVVTIAEKLKHEQECEQSHLISQDETQASGEKSAELNALRKDYYCQTCDKAYKFTTAEILRHKKSCS